MATPSASNEPQEGPGGPNDGRFECNICFEQAKDAVVSMCGHLFWSVPTLYTEGHGIMTIFFCPHTYTHTHVHAQLAVHPQSELLS